jgi:uncharacterized membrane protein (DUF4010 family)
LGAWQAAGIALAIGFLIGSERERDGGQAGVRTFALAGLAGAIAALVHPMVLGAAVAGAALLMAAGYLRQPLGAPEPESDSESEPQPEAGLRQARVSTASAVALPLTVLLGGLAVTQPAVAAGAGVATAVVLLAKERLHSVIREKITELELRDALKFFVAALIVLPLMPQANLGPGGVVDPRRMWTFVVAVTALGALGYIAVRLAGPERGLPAAGLAGGFVSSAATTGAMARTSRDPEFFRPAMAAALLATVASLVELVLVTAVADTRVAGLLTPAVVLAAAVLAGEAGWLLWRKGRTVWNPFERSMRSEGTDHTVRWRAETPSEAAAEEAATEEAAAEEAAHEDATHEDAAHEDAAPEDAATVDLARRERGGNVVIDGGTVTRIDFGRSSAVGSAPRASTVDESTRETPVVDSDTREMPPVRRRTPKALVGRRPFDLVPALLLTAILTVFLVLAALVQQALGPGAAVLAIAVAGLADSHAGALTAGNLASQAALTPQTAALAAAAALAVHTVVKLVLAHAAGGRRASTTLAVLFAAPLLAFALGLTLSLTLS